MEPLRGDEPPGAPRRVAIDRCACRVVAWLPAELSDFVDAAGVPAPLYRVEYETPDATRRDATGLGASVAGDVEDLEEDELQESQRSPNGEPEFGGFGAVVDVAPRGRVWAAFADDPRQTWYGGTVISRSKQTGDLRVVFEDVGGRSEPP